MPDDPDDDRRQAEDLIASARITHGERAPVNRTGDRDPISQLVRQLVYRRDQWTCQRCHATPWANDPKRRSGALHLDHIHPWSANGTDRSDNLRTLCGPCNQERSNRVNQHDTPALGIVGICIPCLAAAGRIDMGDHARPEAAIDIYCASRHHTSWVLPGWQIL